MSTQKNEAATAAAPAVTSSEERTVWIEVTRNYFRGGVMHKPGARIPVPQHALKDITSARPPFGKQVSGPNG